MKMKKHWHFIVALLGIILLNEFIYSFKPSPPVEFISNIIIGIGIIAVLIAWINLWIRKKNNKDFAQNQKQQEYSKDSYKFTLRFWILLAVIALLIISLTGSDYSPIFTSSKMKLLPFVKVHDFDIFLRFYIFCTSLYFAFLKYQDKKLDTAFIFIAVGILFNPFFFFGFGVDFFNVIKLATAILLGYFAYKELKA